MTSEEKRTLAQLLQDLYRLDRFSQCSDRYFRQVYAQKINAVKAMGYDALLLAEAEESKELEE